MTGSSGRWVRFKARLKSAFSVPEEPEFRPTEQQVRIVAKMADWVVRRRLSVPAVMLLESVTPLNYIGSQVLVFFYPFVTVFLNAQDYRAFQEMLEYRESIRYMIEAIEQREEALKKKKKHQSETGVTPTTGKE